MDKLKMQTANLADEKLKKLLELFPNIATEAIDSEGNLVRAIDTKAQIGFMTTSSYGHGEESTGIVKVVNDIPDNIEGLDVLIVDDIIDSGITMDFVINHVKSLGAKSVKTCTLLDKPSRRKVDLKPDYCCFEIEDLFVVGYGLNYGDHYRNIPYIFNWEK